MNLKLAPTTQSWYLVESFLKVRCPHSFCHVSVSRMGQEEFPLGCQSGTDVLPAVNVLLTAVHYADISYAKIGCDCGVGGGDSAAEERKSASTNGRCKEPSSDEASL